mgnify:CR=1 FL=1
MKQYEHKIDQSGNPYLETDLPGPTLIRSPLLNKGTAFTPEERRDFGLSGSFPPHVSTLEEQLQQSYASFSAFQTGLDKHLYLRVLQDRTLERVGDSTTLPVGAPGRHRLA